MINFELVFGNSYHTDPPCKEETCEHSAQKKTAHCKAGECCCPVADKKELLYTRI